MRANLEFKDLGNWLEDIANAGKSVESAAEQLLEEVKPEVESIMTDNLRRTSEAWTGETAGTIQTSGPQKEGNYIYLETEVGGNSRVEAATYKEFGNTRQSAEPFFRPTYRGNRLKNKLRDGMKLMLEKFGLVK